MARPDMPQGSAVHEPIQQLTQLLARLPGIGERSALRLVWHILAAEADYTAALGEAIATLHERVRHCELCGNYTHAPRCNVCSDPRRDAALICVVARVADLWAIERSGSFRGVYHVLHRLLAPLEGIGPEQLPTDALLHRVREQQVREVIAATPLTVEGEATALYLTQLLRSLDVPVSRIASGLPHGGELEFSDQVTLTRALQGRRAFD